MAKVINNWKVIKLGDLLKLEYGKNLPSDKRDGNTYAVYGSNGVVGYHSTPLVNGSGIIIGRKGSIGKLEYSRKPFWPIDTTYYVTTNGSFDIVWAYYLLSTLGLEKMNRSTGVPGLNREDVINIKVLLPGIGIQQKIASILSTVDEEIQKTDQTIDKTRLLKDGLLSKFLGEGKYKLHKLEDLCEIIADCPHTTPKYEPDGKYLVVRTPNVRDGKLNLSEALYTSEDQYLERTKKMMPTPGDVLLTREAPAGEACLVPKNPILCLGQRMMCVRADKLKLLPEFLIYSVYSPVLSKIFKGKSSGTTVSHFNVSDIRKLTIPTPPLDTQKEIIETLSAIDKKLDLEEHSKKSLIDLKNGLMNDFFSQKVEVKL